ncbi:MAG: hypothetical protein K2M84_01160 [Anaeroplasmataceae bacterium]|nr:hypothetical protein [Anaeroplasmataceae bacterium]MDE7384345.1 hypothetical protein [Anaeroplasmataceae bacterium]
MKKYTITALILTLIAGVCAALIACINLFTAPIITKNNEAKKAKLCQEVFETYDASKSTTITEGFSSSSVKEVIVAYDEAGNFLGFIYTVDGSNAYGQIKLLLGITPESKLSGVRFITNGQSFSSEADKHLNTQYITDMTETDVDNLDLKKSDVTAGATYASKLIRSLVKAAFDDAKTREGGAN